MRIVLTKNIPQQKALHILQLFYLVIAIGCGLGGVDKGSTDMFDITEVKQIIYRFIDASVPPQYHRSYSITVSADTAHIVVDSYGKVLAEKDYKISSTQFNNLLTSFKSNNIRNCKLNKGDGCTGGTSEKITLHDSKKEVFSGYVYHCGGDDYGNMCGDISAFATEVKKLVPDLGELVG